MADRDLLRTLLARAATIDVEHDPKLDALLDTLARVDAVATHADERKVILFSYFADTVAYVHDFSAATTDTQNGPVSRSARGDDGRSQFGHPPAHRLVVRPALGRGARGHCRRDRPDAVDGRPRRRPEPPAGGTVINFDLPWNPMRLVQRNGRVDRIGSKHDIVHLYTFFPDQYLDTLLDLEANLRRKIAQANAAVGVETVVIPGDDASRAGIR